MFQAIIHRAQHSVESAVARYAMRVAVAVPFLIALGFGTAAVTIKLVEVYGSVVAYTSLAVCFAAIGLIAVAGIAISESRPVASSEPFTATETEPAAETLDTSPFNSDLLVTALGLAGPRLLPAIPATLRFVARNWALVVSMAIVAYLLMSDEAVKRRQASSADQPLS